jgi:hypothetical protein
MAKQRITETRREPVGFREGYQGKPVPPGAKPVKSPAADVPSKPSNNASPKQSK